jgi:hypothetical protein
VEAGGGGGRSLGAVVSFPFGVGSFGIVNPPAQPFPYLAGKEKRRASSAPHFPPVLFTAERVGASAGAECLRRPAEAGQQQEPRHEISAQLRRALAGGGAGGQHHVAQLRAGHGHAPGEWRPHRVRRAACGVACTAARREPSRDTYCEGSGCLLPARGLAVAGRALLAWGLGNESSPATASAPRASRRSDAGSRRCGGEGGAAPPPPRLRRRRVRRPCGPAGLGGAARGQHQGGLQRVQHSAPQHNPEHLQEPRGNPRAAGTRRPPPARLQRPAGTPNQRRP